MLRYHGTAECRSSSRRCGPNNDELVCDRIQFKICKLQVIWALSAKSTRLTYCRRAMCRIQCVDTMEGPWSVVRPRLHTRSA